MKKKKKKKKGKNLNQKKKKQYIHRTINPFLISDQIKSKINKKQKFIIKSKKNFM